MEHEYQQRLTAGNEQQTERTAAERQRDKLRQGLARLIDSYTEGYLEKPKFESRVTRQRERIAALDEQVPQLADTEALQHQLRLLIGRLEDFATQVEEGLEAADWLTRPEIIRTLVSRVEIAETDVNVVFRVPPVPFVATPILSIGAFCHFVGGVASPLLANIFLHEVLDVWFERDVWLELGDIVIDTGAPLGDACVQIPGVDEPVAPISSVLVMAIVNMLAAEPPACW